MNKSFCYILPSLLLIVLLFGCAAKTYYVQNEDNGFSDQKVGEDVYQIKVKSRNVKDAKRLQDLFYLRAAELARENGYKYFFTVEKVDDLSGMNGRARPFNQRILTVVVYEDITISGLVKFLPEQKELAVKIYNTETVYRQNYYLIEESIAVFGNTNTNNIRTQDVLTNQETSAITNTDTDQIGEPEGLEPKTESSNLEEKDVSVQDEKVNPQDDSLNKANDKLEINLFDTE